MTTHGSVPQRSVAAESSGIIEHLPIGVFTIRVGGDGTLHVASLNAQARAILGDRTRDWSLVEWSDLPRPEDLSELSDVARTMFADPRPMAWEGEILTAQGVRWVRVGTTPAGREGADLVLNATIEDVTERRVAERASARLAADLADTQRIGGIGSWSLISGEPAVWSMEMYRIHGLEPGTPIPDDTSWYARFLALADYARLVRATEQAMRAGGSYEVTYELHRPDGATRHVLSRGAVISDDQGHPLGIHGTTVDITDAVEARRTLEVREAELAEAQYLARVGSWVADTHGRLTWSDECFRIHGLDPSTDEPALDGYFELFGPAEGMEELRALLDAGFRQGLAYETEYTIHRPDGVERHLLARGSPVRDDSGAIRGLRGSVVDITELVEAREALAASERLHRTVVQSLAEAVIVHDLEGRIVAANPAAERILGIQRDELTGLSSFDSRWKASHEDGTPFPGADHPVMVTLRTGQPVHGAVMQVAHPEHARVWLRINSSPIIDEQGQMSAAAVSFEDITEARAAREAELRFNEELERRVQERTAELAAANEELRVFSATVSHDLRAPVRAVAGFARLLQKRHAAELSDEARHWVDNLVEAGETMGRLIDDFLAYARFGAEGLHLEPIDLAPIMAWLRSTLVERIAESDATVRIEEPLAVPVGDPVMVRRMLLNLVDNALAYGRPGVPPTVVLAAHRQGDRVVISVADNGRGIDPAALERIFEVFARVEPGRDLAHAGIGLAMVRKAARAMNTEVEVESVPNVGTTFRFSLPAADPEPGA